MTDSLDLSRRKQELEQIFSSVINKLPDLCHPRAPLLAGEDDFFNKTKDLKLTPFKKQEVFERCMTPTLDEARHESASSPTSELVDMPERCTSSCSLRRSPAIFSKLARPQSAGSGSPIVRQSKVSFGVTGGAAVRSQRVAPMEKRARDARSPPNPTEETRARLELRARLHERYSRLRLKPRPETAETKRRETECLNRIFADQGDGPPSPAYPFANPMPECMLTRDNLGNLREIMMATTSDIEWRMLTPVRPATEYEELYFDKLVQLHRLHYKYQQDEAAARVRSQKSRHGDQRQRQHLQRVQPTARPRFRHTRHAGSEVAPHQLQRPASRRLAANEAEHALARSQVSMSLGMKLKGKFHTRSLIAAQSNLNIPQLILTADDEADLDGGGGGDESSMADNAPSQQQQQQRPHRDNSAVRAAAAHVQQRRRSVQNTGAQSLRAAATTAIAERHRDA